MICMRVLLKSPGYVIDALLLTHLQNKTNRTIIVSRPEASGIRYKCWNFGITDTMMQQPYRSGYLRPGTAKAYSNRLANFSLNLLVPDSAHSRVSMSSIHYRRAIRVDECFTVCFENKHLDKYITHLYGWFKFNL
jgi:hypothetical protein